MSAEKEVVNFWLNRKGYFTVNNLKSGNKDIGILALKFDKGSLTKVMHVEVNCSITGFTEQNYVMDKLIDETLKNAGFPGDTLGERLMGMERGQLATLDGLWEAHKIRNKIAHDSNYFMRYAEAKKAVELYEKTLNELGAI